VVILFVSVLTHTNNFAFLHPFCTTIMSANKGLNIAQYVSKNNSKWNGETAGLTSLKTTTSKTHNDWNADTGATSHMTPYHHWLIDYKPYVVPIKLADNTIVYSAGVGSVVFNPIIEGKKCRPVQFTRVLHVPMLRHNLLSVLFLTRQRKFKVHIDADHMHFILDGDRLFKLSVASSSCTCQS